MSEERGWLLERQNGFLRQTEWVTVDNGMLTWTGDSLRALRLARREDGDMLATIVEDAERITEHLWPPGPDISQVPALAPATHCEHFADIKMATHLLSREGKPTLLLCDACAETLRQKGEPVKKIEHWLWGFPVVLTGESTTISRPVVAGEDIQVPYSCVDFRLPAHFTFDPENTEEQAEIERRAAEHLKTCTRCNKALLETEVTGEVREFHFKCGNPDGEHEWSVMAKPTFDIDFSPLCMADGCSYNGVYVGDNQAEIAKNPADLLDN